MKCAKEFNQNLINYINNCRYVFIKYNAKFKVPKVDSTIILTLRKVYKILLTKIGFRATSKVKFSSRKLNQF